MSESAEWKMSLEEATSLNTLQVGSKQRRASCQKVWEIGDEELNTLSPTTHVHIYTYNQNHTHTHTHVKMNILHTSALTCTSSHTHMQTRTRTPHARTHLLLPWASGQLHGFGRPGMSSVCDSFLRSFKDGRSCGGVGGVGFGGRLPHMRGRHRAHGKQQARGGRLHQIWCKRRAPMADTSRMFVSSSPEAQTPSGSACVWQLQP